MTAATPAGVDGAGSGASGEDGSGAGDGSGSRAAHGAGRPAQAVRDRQGRLSDWEGQLRDWPEVVTAALLGTDRRPLPERLLASLPGDDVAVDAPAVVLNLAAAHRAAALTTAGTSSCPAGAVAPAELRPQAPPAAQGLLGALLARGEPALVTAWLRAAAQRGLVVGYEHWPRLAGLAARSRTYDRAALREVLGVRGTWLLRQHPQWVVLADDKAAPPALSGDPAAVLADVRAGVPPAQLLAGALGCPDPWPPELARMALWLLGAGALGTNTHRLATQLAHRLPLTPAGEPDGWAAEDLTDAGPPPVALLRTVATSVALVERTVEARAAIVAAFDQPDEPDPAPDQEPGAAP